MIRISHPTAKLRGRLQVPGSKSESNRLLILQALYAPEAQIEGLSTSRDTVVMRELLENYQSSHYLNVGDAGTAMRFLTAFLAQADGEWTLDGSSRMRERPIKVLIDALRQLGAQINYLEKEGYPPLKIKGQSLKGGSLRINAEVSSQYLSALMMMAPGLERGLELKLEGHPVSMPYLQLTGNLMRRMGFPVFILGDEIRIPAHQLSSVPEVLRVEPDWSAASYWFGMALLSREAEIYLAGFEEHSLQGDSIVQQLMAPLGVEQIFIGGGIRIRKSKPFPIRKELNLLNTPDLAQSLIPIYAALNKEIHFKGLQTLRIKETDRIAALENELRKFNCVVQSGDKHLSLKGGFKASEVRIATYGDHRMAMGFTPLALLKPLEIENPAVVEKSYPGFWNDCEVLGFKLEKL